MDADCHRGGVCSWICRRILASARDAETPRRYAAEEASGRCALKKSLAFLVFGTVAIWLVVGIPARLLWGESSLLFSATAAVLCLLPAAGTFVWTRKSFRGTPEQQ